MLFSDYTYVTTLAPGGGLCLAKCFKRQGFAVALHLRKPQHS